jgi:predicted membrane protein
MIFSKYVIVNTSVFLAGLIFLLFSPFSIVLNILALLFLGIGFLMVAYALHKTYKKLKKTTLANQEELILEMVTEDGGEEYVYKKSRLLKKQNKEIRNYFRDRMLTIIAFYTLGIAFIYFSIRLVF